MSLRILRGPALLLAGLLAAGPAAAATDAEESLVLSPGRSQTLEYPIPVGSAFVADPAVADVEVLDDHRLFLFGRSPGLTSLTIHDGAGRLIRAYTVRVHTETEYARLIASHIAGGGHIGVDSVGNALVVTGRPEGPEQAEAVLAGVRAVAGETPVVDAMARQAPVQVNLEVLISEVSSEVTDEFGIDWSLDINPFTNPMTTLVHGLRMGSGLLQLGGKYDQELRWSQPVPVLQDDGTVKLQERVVAELDFEEFGIVNPPPRGGEGGIVLSFHKDFPGSKYRTTAFLEALARNGLAVVHAKPNLTTKSGESATFFSGLEIPVPKITRFALVGTEYLETGVSLAFTPTALEDGRVSLVVEATIREVAPGGTTIAGAFVPNVNDRSAATTVEVADGESIAIAGLYRRINSSSESGIPLLKDIPFWGALFRNRAETERSVELVIVVTPRVVSPFPAQLAQETLSGASLAVEGQPLDNRFYY